VTVTVSRAGKLVKRYRTGTRRAARTHRLRLGYRGLPRGDYRVRVRAVAGTERQTRTLTSRRL
jgi:predicted phage tail protein